MTEKRRRGSRPWSVEASKEVGNDTSGSLVDGKARVSFDLGYTGAGSSGKLRTGKSGSILNGGSEVVEAVGGGLAASNAARKLTLGRERKIPELFSFSDFKVKEDELGGGQRKDEEVKLLARGVASSKRNQAKVSYTYRPQMRPSSPSYMASTASSRQRASTASSRQRASTGADPGLYGPVVKKINNVPSLALVKGGYVGKVRSLKLEATSAQSSSSSLTWTESPLSPLSVTASPRGTDRLSGNIRGRVSKAGRKGGGRLWSLLTNEGHSSPGHALTVLMKEKLLMKVFNYLEWTELLAMRCTCKKWQEIISTEAPLQKVGVICLRRTFDGMEIFNRSMYVWTQFRIHVSAVFDFTDPVQQEFWNKHGKTMSYLQIRNASMTLSALVEILSRCPNLEHFTVTWTAEMYSFNSDMIKKYYGIQFRNGTFVKLHELVIDKSYFLTDNALWSLLKWCGGSIYKLSLTCGPEDQEDSLSRLKPRWSIEPIQNYASRFGYSGNFRFLDFSGSNLNTDDLKTLAKTEKLHSLVGIRLTHCKINDDSLQMFILRKGSQLEELHLDQTSITEKAFEESTKLPRLRVLNISGRKGNFHHLEFFPYLKSLEDFICSDTTWLTYTTLARPLEAFGNRTKQLRNLNLSSSVNIIPRVDQRMSKIWFGNFARLCSHLRELNLSHCGVFGNDENFKAICTHIFTLEALSVRDWTTLTDEGVVGMGLDDIYKQQEDVAKGLWKSETILKISPVLCNLKRLKYLDLGGCKRLTDMCVQFAIIHLENLSKLSLEKTQITDASIHLLASKTSNLNRLCVSGCENVTPINLNFVTKTNGRLVFFGKI